MSDLTDRVITAGIDIDLEAYKTDTADMLKQINALTDAQAKLKKETGKLQNATDEQLKTYVSQEGKLKDLRKSYNQNVNSIAALETGTKGLKKALDEEVKSQSQAEKNNAKLIAIRKKLNGETEAGKAAIENINKKMDANNAIIDKNVSKREAQIRGVAKYEEGILSALGKVQIFGVNLGTVAAQGTAAARGMDTAGSSMSRFSKILVATPLGAFVIVLGTLASAFASTQEGLDRINSVLRPLSALFQRFLGILQTQGLKAFQDLRAAIDDPIGALQRLGEAIVDNVINRFKALAVLGEAISKLFAGDFKGAAKTATDAVIQMGTGVENATDKITNAANEMANFIQESIDAGSRIDELTKDIERSENELIKRRAELTTEFERQKEIAQDVSNTEEERLAAAKAAIQAQNDLLQLEQSFKLKQIELKKLENELNDTSRQDLKDLANLEAEYTRYVGQAARKRASARNLEKAIIREIESDQNKQHSEEGKRLQEELERDQRRVEEKLELQALEFEEQFILKELNGENEKTLQAERIAFDAMQDEQRILAEDTRRKAQIQREISDETERSNALKLLDQQTKTALLENEVGQFTRIKALRDKELDDIFYNSTLTRNEKISAAQSIRDEQIRAVNESSLNEVQKAELVSQVVKQNEEFRTDITRAENELRRQTARSVAGAITAIFGEQSRIGKAVALTQIGIESGVATARGIAAANAVPFPANLAAIATTIAAVATNIRNAKNIVKKAKFPKLRQGGLIKLNGPSHEDGGVGIFDQYGNQLGEAEGGEMVGVLNKSASQAFMNFNNQFNGNNSGIEKRLDSLQKEIKNKKFNGYALFIEGSGPSAKTIEHRDRKYG